jgi:hypothetical protein
MSIAIYTGAQINFEDLTPYFTFVINYFLAFICNSTYGIYKYLQAQ